MVRFIDQHRGVYGVEPICAELPIASSSYYEYKAREADPSRLPARHRRDAEIVIDIEPIGDIPPAEFEQAYYDQLGGQAIAA